MALAARDVRYLPQLMLASPTDVRRWLAGKMDGKRLAELQGLLRSLPALRLALTPPATALEPNADGVVTVAIEGTNPASRRHVYAPAFPKPKIGGWWLVMGDEDELFALKRVQLPPRGTFKTDLHFMAPEEPGEYKV